MQLTADNTTRTTAPIRRHPSIPTTHLVRADALRAGDVILCKGFGIQLEDEPDVDAPTAFIPGTVWALQDELIEVQRRG